MNEAIKLFTRTLVNKSVEWNNELKPRIQSTVKPSKKYTFNEISDNLYNEIKPKNEGLVKKVRDERTSKN